MGDVAQFIENGWEWASFLATATLFKVNRVEVTTFGLVQVLLVLCAAWWVSRLLQRALVRIGASHKSISPASLYTLGRLMHYAIIALSIMLGLSMVGLDFSNLAFLAGAIGVGLGFGMQTLVNNFVSGIMLLIERSLKVGDFVELASGVAGEVQEINIRSTLITTNDNIDILVPNSEFINGRMTNWTLREETRRLRVPFGVEYGTDKETVKLAGLEAAAAVGHTLDAPGKTPEVWLVGYGENAVNFELVVWLNAEAVRQPPRVRAEYLWALDTALAGHGVELPAPQKDFRLVRDEEAVSRDLLAKDQSTQ
jgi:small-conductance mechanosensitive channel